MSKRLDLELEWSRTRAWASTNNYGPKICNEGNFSRLNFTKPFFVVLSSCLAALHLHVLELSSCRKISEKS